MPVSASVRFSESPSLCSVPVRVTSHERRCFGTQIAGHVHAASVLGVELAGKTDAVDNFLVQDCCARYACWSNVSSALILVGNGDLRV